MVKGNYSGVSILSTPTLTINGGTVEGSNTNSTGYGFSGNNLVMNGGTATFTGGSFSVYGINANVTFNGGKLAAMGDEGISGNTTISWKNATDRIKASSYRGSVTITDGKYMKDASGNFYFGTLIMLRVDCQKVARRLIKSCA